jgi:transcription termination/antitermination protein NusA
MATVTSSRSELMAAIRGLSAARDLPPEVIVDALKAALASAYHKMPGASATNVTVDLDEHTGESRVLAHYVVVDPQYIEDSNAEWTVEQARDIKPDAEIGDNVTIDVTPEDFGRIAAQTAKQVILQRIREAEREQTYTTYADREGEIVYGTVQTVNRDSISVALDRVEAILPKAGQIPGEAYTPNQRIRVYVSEVKRSPKGPQVVVSRTQREMLKRLMELEIPEVFQGVVEIKGIAREAGSRSKVAVWAHQDGVDPVGACVGMRGVRIQALVRELGGEKIDVVEWDPDPRVFIAHALSPAKVMHVWLDEDSERRTANVIVPDSQLSLAIGREGQNARLAAKLTGWRIDIRAESEAGEILARLRAEDALRVVERAPRRPAAPAVPEPEEMASEIAPELPETGAPAVEVLPPAATTPAEEAPVSVAPVAPAKPETEAASSDDARRKAHAEVTPPATEAEEEEDSEALWLQPGAVAKRKKKRLVRDPVTGRLIAEKPRKGSRVRPEWEDDLGRWSESDLEDAMGFTEDDFVRSDEQETAGSDEGEEVDEEVDEIEAEGDVADDADGDSEPTDRSDEDGGARR